MYAMPLTPTKPTNSLGEHNDDRRGLRRQRGKVMATETQRLQRLVNEFSQEMKTALLRKRGAGWTGWEFDDKSGVWRSRCVRAANDHLLRGVLHNDPYQLVGAANFCAFYWNLQRKAKALEVSDGGD